MRKLIIALLIIVALAIGDITTHTRAEVHSLQQQAQSQAREIRNLKGVVHDQAETLHYLTHPATVQQRQLDYIMGRGEFKK